MVDFETRVNRTVQTDAHGQYGDRQVRVATRVGRSEQRYGRTELTCEKNRENEYKKKKKNYLFG